MIIKTALIYLTILFVFIPLNVLAIGQITKPILIDNALRGQTFEQILILINTENKESKIDLLAEGDIEKWAKFYQDNNSEAEITTISLRPKEQKTAIVRFEIPEGTPNGKYKGYVSILQKAKAEENNNETVASIRKKIGREVTIFVTDKENVDFSAAIIPESYNLSPGDSFKFRVIYHNSGNITVKPTIQVKLSQADNIIYNAIMPYPENEGGVGPLKIQEIPVISAPTNGAAMGKVKATVVIKNNEEIIEEKEIRFSLGYKAPEIGNTVSNFLYNNKNNKNVWGSFLLVLTAGLLVSKIAINRRKVS